MINKWTSFLSVLNIFMIFTTSRANACTDALSTEPSDEKPVNLVVEPTYLPQKTKKEDKEGSVPTLEKLQYEAIDSAPPLLEEKEGKVERTNGAEYEKGNELHIAPKSDYVIKSESIHERMGKIGLAK